MVKSKVIFEDEEQVEIKYPCFELKDIVEYYFEICTPNNSITPFSLVALPNANILVSIYISDSSQTFKVHREHGIIDTIYYINTNRNYKLNTVSKEVGVSNPTLNRYFKEVLGISPKQCFKALRFKTALKNYRANGSYDLYDELGYTDFSHFVKEAKNLANTTPSEL